MAALVLGLLADLGRVFVLFVVCDSTLPIGVTDLSLLIVLGRVFVLFVVCDPALSIGDNAALVLGLLAAAVVVFDPDLCLLAAAVVVCDPDLGLFDVAVPAGSTTVFRNTRAGDGARPDTGLDNVIPDEVGVALTLRLPFTIFKKV